ncbi:hypothetical protein LTR37_021273 [Vermiconidia calcicola]|uniref:Uncharacterized protein n=1 Tax=Vermiconidia calcicola TaxID=1690605 RepID=A0ACC3MC01_9PEZI|nr:hypothetical protein LTR37_021273 [Vermiconidia calcicola]
MDHLPASSSANKILLPDVPFLASFEYDFLGFDGFPKRCGFDVKSLRTGHDAEEVASLLQSWLYFDILAELFRKVHLFEDFTYQPEAGTPALVTSRRLFEYLDEWTGMVRRSRRISPSWKNTISASRAILEIVTKASSAFDFCPGLEVPRYAAVAMSCKILVITLIWTFNNLEPYHPIDTEVEVLRPWRTGNNLVMPHPARYLEDQMESLGWCVSLARRLCKRLNYSAALLLVNLVPRYDKEKHQPCSSEVCHAYSIDPKSYTTRHITSDCGCHFVSAPVNELVRIIESGQIPIVSTTVDASNTLQVRTVSVQHDQFSTSASAFRSYVALSHVWADGLGNTKSNALPHCQFKRITEQMETLAQSGETHARYFWLDTLCIPVGEANEAVRLKAIDQIALAYASASYVLVLDGSLLPIRKLGTPPIAWMDPPALGVQPLIPFYIRDSEYLLEASRILGQILCCPWAGRSWTLQEGALATVTHFALRDGTLTSGWLRTAASRYGKKRTSYSRSVGNGVLGIGTRPFFSPFKLCCTKQSYERLHRSVSNLHDNPHLEPKELVELVSAILLFACSTLAACELVTYNLALIAVVMALYLLGALLALLPLLVLFLTYLPSIIRTRRQWRIARCRTNKIKDVLSLCLLCSLAQAAERMLHTTDRPLAQVAGGRPDLQPRLRRDQLLRVWNILANRNTTKPEDTHLFIGTMTNLRVQGLKDLNSLQRMYKILRSFEELPVGLLFQHSNVRSPSDGQDSPLLPVYPSGDISLNKTSFRAVERGFKLNFKEKCSGLSFFFLGTCAMKEVSALSLIEEKSKVYQVTFKGIRSWSKEQLERKENMGVLMQRNDESPQQQARCVLEGIMFSVAEHNGQLLLKFIHRVLLERLVAEASDLSRQQKGILSEADVSGRTDCTILYDWTTGQQHRTDSSTSSQPLAYQPPHQLEHALSYRTMGQLVFTNLLASYSYALYAVVVSKANTTTASFSISVLVDKGLLSIGLDISLRNDPTGNKREALRRAFISWMELWEGKIARNFPESDERLAVMQRKGSFEKLSRPPEKDESGVVYLFGMDNWPGRGMSMTDIAKACVLFPI